MKPWPALKAGEQKQLIVSNLENPMNQTAADLTGHVEEA